MSEPGPIGLKPFLIRLCVVLAIVAVVAGFAASQHWLGYSLGVLRVTIPQTANYYWTFTAPTNLVYTLAAALGLCAMAARRSAKLRSMWPAIFTATMLAGTTAYCLMRINLVPPLFYPAIAAVLVLSYLLQRSKLCFAVMLDRVRATYRARRLPAPEIAVALAGFVALVVVAIGVYRMQPFVLDCCAELFHARILERGMLKMEAPPNPESFHHGNTICDAVNGWYSQYPPGQILFDAVMDSVGAAWMVNAVFGIGIILLTYRIARDEFGPMTGKLSLCLLLVSPYFFQMQSGMMSHGSMAFMCLLVLRILLRIDRAKHAVAWSMVGGLVIGYAMATRPLTAIGFVAPLAVWAAWRRLPRLGRRWSCLAAAVAGFAITIGGYLLFNWLTNGSPFRSSYQVNNLEIFGLGFSADFTVPQGLMQSLNNIYSMNDYLFGFSFGSFVLIGIFVLWGQWGETDFLLLAICLSLSAVYTVYHYQDFWYGPRFLYEVLPLLVILSARGLALVVNGIASTAGAPWQREMRVRGAALLLVFFACCSAFFAADKLGAIRTQCWGSPFTKNVHDNAQPNDVIFVSAKYGHTFMIYNAGYPRGPLFPRDLGVRENAELMRAMPGRRFLIYPVGNPIALPYDEALTEEMRAQQTSE